MPQTGSIATSTGRGVTPERSSPAALRLTSSARMASAISSCSISPRSSPAGERPITATCGAGDGRYDAAELPVLIDRSTRDLPAELRRDVVHAGDLIPCSN